MRLTLCLAIFILLASGLNAVTTEVGSIRGFLYGTEPGCAYDNWVSHVSEGQVSWLNVYAPWEEQNDDFGDFRVPSSEDLLSWDGVIADFLALDLDAAQAKIRSYGFPYEVVQFQDLDSGRVFYMLREFLNDDVDPNGTIDTSDDETGSFDYGWGLYIFNPSASRPIVVTQVHPCDDYPGPVFALESFLKLDARFLLIAGAGREVAYIPPYNSNNQSLSDPSRNPDHPFNVAYQHCCDQIRGLTGRTELSLQIHTYDWNKYSGQPNVMLSSGYGREFPALPVRDNSRARNDLLDRTPYVVHPQNSIGTHSEVDIDDFYCVNYNYADPVTYLHNGQEIQLPENTELPGAEFNQQMLYTEQQNLYDVFSPFLHVEMDELPKCYSRNEDTWRWFFGYVAETQTWDLAQRYTRFIQFYTPWLDALYAVVDSVLALDDGTGPSNPENLTLTDMQSNYAYLAWDRSYSYDFDSYELHLRWEVDGQEVSQVLDRVTDPLLAWQKAHSFTLDLPVENRIIYARILARDKHGNFSPSSNEIKIWNTATIAGNFSAAEGDNVINLSFDSDLSQFQGFNIYRGENGANYFRLASWHQNPGLLPNQAGSYAFTDSTVANGTVYDYQLSAEFADGTQLFHWETKRASPFRRYPFVLSNSLNGTTKTLWIGISPLASDGTDKYDLRNQASSGSLQIGTTLASETYIYYQDIRPVFDPASAFKCWHLRYRCDYVSSYLTLTPDPNLIFEGAELLLYDVQNDHWHDLRLGPYVWLGANNNGWRYLDLYWGRQAPRVQFSQTADVYQYLGENLDLQWEVINQPRVDSVDLYLRGVPDTLQIASGLPPRLTEFSFVPAMPVSGAQLAVVLNLSDGTDLSFSSSRRFSLIPPNLVYQGPPGYSLLSFPSGGFDQSVAELLGDTAAAWSFTGSGAWQPAQNLYYGLGYLISQPQPFQISLPAVMPNHTESLPIYPGWNLIPNPFSQWIELKNLNFTGPGIQKSYTEMVDELLLLPRAMLYGPDGFTLADALPPGQSAFLYYAGSVMLYAVFDPWSYGDEAINWEDHWNVTLNVSDGFYSGDSVQAGSSDLSSTGFDQLCDLPKAPEFPESPYRLALQRLDPQTGITHELQCEYQGLYPDYDQTEKIWNFTLEVNVLQPLRLNLESSRLPQDYSVEVFLFGQLFSYVNTDHFWFDPPAAGIHTGWLRIRSYTPGRDEILSDAAISIYPNPFQDKVSIQLTDVKSADSDIAIYNLRGQKVRKLAAVGKFQEGSALVWDGRDDSGRPLAAGIYLLKVSDGKGSYTRRLVKY